MPVQQHPIPQDVSNYKFRLVGDMTLKQFLQLAVGVIIGLIFWSSPLPFFFKYPLTVIFVCLGVGMAFVPVEGRPLDQWLIAFIKSIYSPTIFVWEKSGTNYSSKPTNNTTPITPTATSVIRPPTPTFTASGPKPLPIPTYSPVTPAPTLPTPTPQPTTNNSPSIFPPTPPAPIPNLEIRNSKLEINPTPPPPTNTQYPITPPSIPHVTPAYQPGSRPITPSPNTHTSPLEIKASNLVDTATPISTKSGLPIPFTPTTPNTLVGMVLTSDSHIIENAIIEIIHNGLTIRATKSNKLGQFLFARPLDNGTYHIGTQKDGHNFETYALTLAGQVVPPLKLQAKI